ncbi:MAG: hypothetical protein LLG01_15315 [Planctomycetaceae bacterium]|nr:hypothetical protein [Planctomycetaceae bacterium]
MWRASVMAVLVGLAACLAAQGQATTRAVNKERQAAMTAELAALMRKLADNPADAKVRTELIRFCLIRMNAPDKASTLLHVSVDETLRRLVPLACKKTEELDAPASLELGKWYLCDLAVAAPAGEDRTEMLRRARACLEHFLDIYPPKNASRIEAMVLLDDAGNALNGGPLPLSEKETPKPAPKDSAPSKDPAGPVVIEVNAQAMWTAAGQYKKGQSLEFHATGIWSVQAQRGSCTPDGRAFDEADGEVRGYLRGRIAGGEPFKIGSKLIMAVPAEGPLELGMDEGADPKSYLDNSGSIKVTIIAR